MCGIIFSFSHFQNTGKSYRAEWEKKKGKIITYPTVYLWPWLADLIKKLKNIKSEDMQAISLTCIFYKGQFFIFWRTDWPLLETSCDVIRRLTMHSYLV